jgi:hypothetical protein
LRLGFLRHARESLGGQYGCLGIQIWFRYVDDVERRVGITVIYCEGHVSVGKRLESALIPVSESESLFAIKFVLKIESMFEHHV